MDIFCLGKNKENDQLRELRKIKLLNNFFYNGINHDSYNINYINHLNLIKLRYFFSMFLSKPFFDIKPYL